MLSYPRNASEAKTLCNIADRAANLTADYHCFIFQSSVEVIRNDDPSRSYNVKDGVCNCPSYAKFGTCKHEQGAIALILKKIEIYKLENTLFPNETSYCDRKIKWGEEMAEAWEMRVPIASYRNREAMNC